MVERISWSGMVVPLVRECMVRWSSFWRLVCSDMEILRPRCGMKVPAGCGVELKRPHLRSVWARRTCKPCHSKPWLVRVGVRI